MQQWSHPEHLEGPTTQGAPITGKVQDWSLQRFRMRRESTVFCCAMGRAPLWAWLLLGVLVVPGARSFLNEEQEELLVELHNYYRGQVSPSASAMLPLRWDPNLKVVAERYAANCIWNHNPELVETGENLFAGTGQLDLRMAMEKWFLEHLDYNFDNNSCDEDKMCGHYTQMVWAGTHRVGCAFHLCNNMEGLSWERVSFLVCNYFPAGNYEGERPYVEGEWCSQCPENLQNCENNLCVADAKEEDEDEEEDEGIEEEVEEDEVEEEEEEDKVDEEEQQDVTEVPATQTPPFISIDVNVHTVKPDIPPSSTPSRPETGSDHTPPPATDVPKEPTVTVGAEKEVKVEDEAKKEKEEQQNERSGKKGAETTRNVPPKIKQTLRAAASVSIPSVLVICVTAVLTIRL